MCIKLASHAQAHNLEHKTMHTHARTYSKQITAQKLFQMTTARRSQGLFFGRGNSRQDPEFVKYLTYKNVVQSIRQRQARINFDTNREQFVKMKQQSIASVQRHRGHQPRGGVGPRPFGVTSATARPNRQQAAFSMITPTILEPPTDGCATTIVSVSYEGFHSAEVCMVIH